MNDENKNEEGNEDKANPLLDQNVTLGFFLKGLQRNPEPGSERPPGAEGEDSAPGAEGPEGPSKPPGSPDYSG